MEVEGLLGADGASELSSRRDRVEEEALDARSVELGGELDESAEDHGPDTVAPVSRQDPDGREQEIGVRPIVGVAAAAESGEIARLVIDPVAVLRHTRRCREYPELVECEVDGPGLRLPAQLVRRINDHLELFVAHRCDVVLGQPVCQSSIQS
ncbi:MAG: hypothetical protein WAL25_14955 [Acidimicrobiia bacterium]